MGAYLSEPNTECNSEDGETVKLRYGSSAMQGWRLGMEDGHNCIPNIDDGTAMFAVYDGHGGAEVAMYCCKYLPGVIKSQAAYKEGNMDKALQDSFMEIDATLKEHSAIEELRHLAGMEHSTDEADAEEASALQEEANLPLGELLARYSYHPTKTRSLRKKLDKNDLLSPMVRKKPPSFGEASSTDNANGLEDNKMSIPLRLDEVIDDEESGSKGKGQGDNGEETEGSVKAGKTDSKDSEEISKCNGSEEVTEEILNGRLEEDKENEKKEAEENEDAEDEDDEDDDDEESDSEEEEEEDDGDCDDDDDDDEEADDDEERDVFRQQEEPGSDSGCTSVVALIRDQRIIVANAGDSRCVLSKGGKAIDLSIDHKPEDDIEITRIEKAGGKVTADGRVNGGLNLSRAIGDHCYKCTSGLPAEEQMISAFPDIQTAQLTSDNDLMVIACDGIWNVMTSQEVIDFVRERIKVASDAKSSKLSDICEELFRFCLAPDTSGDGTGCDNMTCVIVQFIHELPDQSLAAAMKVGKRKASTDAPSADDNNSKRHKD